MTTTTSEQLKKDLATLQIDIDHLETLSVQQASTQYRKVALTVHPDKADPHNPKQVEEFTAAFQELGNCYQRVLKYIVERLQSEIEPMNDEDLFARENFDNFNFPFENQGSFTVKVEDDLAEVWQDCFESVFGAPRIVKTPKGTESDRIWKIIFEHEGRKSEITVHFYNHNKPKHKKQSLFLIQGGIQSFLCEFVFTELPKIYKLVSMRKVKTVAPLRYPKRKRISTPVKKRNIKYKPTAKHEGINCGFCDFTSFSNVKMIRHMKTSHTKPCTKEDVSSSAAKDVPLLVEDMSMCLISDDEEENDITNKKLLVEDVQEDNNAAPFVKPLPLYKCNGCQFATTTTENLKEHKKSSHEIERQDKENIVFLHSCISCNFKTNDYSSLLEHTANNHLIHPELSKKKSMIFCTICNDKFDGEGGLKEHTESHHAQLECKACEQKFSSELALEWHLETEHEEDILNAPDSKKESNKNVHIPTSTQVNIEEPPKSTGVAEMPAAIPCPFCQLLSKNTDALKTHIENIHFAKEDNKSDGDDISVKGKDTCSKCSNCNFVGSEDELVKHVRSKHKIILTCKDCGNKFPDMLTLENHIQAKHPTEPFPCESCGLVLGNFPLLQEHMKSTHSPILLNCHCCDYSATDKEGLQIHFMEAHEEVFILHTTATMVSDMSDRFATFETFNANLKDILKTVLDNQNALKQELFVLRNNQAKQTSNKVSQAKSSETPAEESPPRCPSPCPAGPASPAPPVRSTPNPNVSFPPKTQSPKSSTSNLRPPRVTPPKEQNPQSRILYIGDSISATADIKSLEVATQSKFVTAKAYSAVNDAVSNAAKQAAKYPSSNFTDVVKTQLGKEDYKYLILQAGSVDITNLNTKDNPEEYLEYYRQEAIMSATNIFNAGVNALKSQPSLGKVVIMKHIPRYDPTDVDPMSLKPSLSLLFNNTMTNLWMESPYKQKMFVGNHEIECTGAIRESRYCHTKSGRYDGIHLYGNSGSKAYTLSVLSILRAAHVTSSEHDFHLSCAQYKYQNRQKNGNHSNEKGNHWQRVKSNDRKYSGRKHYQPKIAPVPTSSRFARLSDLDQGN